MALTKEIITANAALSALTPEQQEAIVTLSKNDEADVVGKRIGEIYTEMDKKVQTHGGVERNGDEKTYDYVERALKQLKAASTSGDEQTKQIQVLTAEKTRLEKLVADGAGDAEIKRQLQQNQADLENVRSEYNKLKSDHTEAVSKHEKELFSLKTSDEINTHLSKSGIKLKEDFPEATRNMLYQQAVDYAKGLSPQYVDSGKGDGTKVLAFHNKEGVAIRNKEKGLEFSTPSDIVTSKLKEFGVLDEVRTLIGGGSGPDGGKDKQQVNVDVSTAKTRVEATKIIHTALGQQGLVNGTDEFQSAMNQAWADNKVSELPMQ